MIHFCWECVFSIWEGNHLNTMAERTFEDNLNHERFDVSYPNHCTLDGDTLACVCVCVCVCVYVCVHCAHVCACVGGVCVVSVICAQCEATLILFSPSLITYRGPP